MSWYMRICPKCASLKVNRKCIYCGVERIEVDLTNQERMNMTDRQREEFINHCIETIIKDTYDPKAREYREANEEPPFAHYVQENVAKCPTCQSANIRKIGGLERGASVAVAGIFSRKINKTFKCNSCGYTW